MQTPFRWCLVGDISGGGDATGVYMPMDTAISRAMARKESLEKEIESRQAELQDIDMFVTLYQRFAGPEETLVTVTMPIQAEIRAVETDIAAASQPEIRTVMRRGISQEEFNEVAPQLLKEHGKPARRGEFLRLFHARNIPIGGVNEMLNFGTKVWKAREVLINLPGEGYWPRDLPYEPAGYDPTDPFVNDAIDGVESDEQST